MIATTAKKIWFVENLFFCYLGFLFPNSNLLFKYGEMQLINNLETISSQLTASWS